MDFKKDFQSIENINTSVDITSNYGEENLDIKNLHNFKSHLSDLKYISIEDMNQNNYSENVYLFWNKNF